MQEVTQPGHAAVVTVDAEDLLRGASLRVTAPRVAVLHAADEHSHSDADELIQLVRSQLGAVSKQAVYDVLKALTDAGLIRRIEPSGSSGPRSKHASATTITTSYVAPAGLDRRHRLRGRRNPLS